MLCVDIHTFSSNVSALLLVLIEIIANIDWRILVIDVLQALSHLIPNPHNHPIIGTIIGLILQVNGDRKPFAPGHS